MGNTQLNGCVRQQITNNAICLEWMPESLNNSLAMPLTSLISTDESDSLNRGAGSHLRKVLQALLGESEAMIPVDGFPGTEAVHDIRVNMKRARAILKLLRAAPKALFYRNENAALRDISALFSRSREAAVMNKTLKMLRKRAPGLFGPETVEWFRNEVAANFNHKEVNVDKIVIATEAADRLRRAWYRIGFLSLREVTRITLLDGLWNSFQRAEVEYRKAVASKHPEDIHEFRKRTKDLLYQVRFFSDYNPDHLGKLFSNLDTIGSLLGKCNDLSVVEMMVTSEVSRKELPDRVKVLNVIREERARLFTESTPIASSVFATFYSGS